MPRLVASLVTWNSAKYISACLHALAEQTYRDVQLVIIDNASTDGTREWLLNNESGMRNQASHPLHDSLFLIPNSENCGYAGAHNQAMRWAMERGAEFVLVLNPDVVLAPDALASMIRVMDEHPRAGSVGIPLFRSDTVIDSLGIDIGWGGRFFECGAGEEYVGERGDEQVLGISGACVMYRLAALAKVAYHTGTDPEFFDERFFAYKEDIDLSLRLQEGGWEVWLTHAAHGMHTRAVADASKGIVFLQYRHRDQRSRARSYLSYRNHLYVLKKHWRYLPVSGIGIIVYELGKAVYALVREPWLLKAWKEALKLKM